MNIIDQFFETANRAARRVVGPAIGACIVAYFVYYTIYGDRGLIAMRQMQNDIARAEVVLQHAKAQRELLKRRATLLRPDNLDLDMLDERVREVLNFSHPNEVIIVTSKPERAGPLLASTSAPVVQAKAGR